MLIQQTEKIDEKELKKLINEWIKEFVQSNPERKKITIYFIRDKIIEAYKINLTLEQIRHFCLLKKIKLPPSRKYYPKEENGVVYSDQIEMMQEYKN